MTEINSLASFLNELQLNEEFDDGVMWLYRGQCGNYPLIPGIARLNSRQDTSELEIKMLEELKRRGNLLVKEKLLNDWDWLVYAQHFGMATRLLDWSTNPLVALWFAISNHVKFEEPSYLYLLTVYDEDFLTESDKMTSPFSITRTRVLRPVMNNNRVVAQQGWFTSHIYASRSGKFIGLEKNNKYGKKRIKHFVIPSAVKRGLLIELNALGINNQSLFPDIVGLCKQINWENKIS
jgi:hypothetical protein